MKSMGKEILFIAFCAGAATAGVTTSRGANCLAGYHFLTIFMWSWLVGKTFPEWVIFPLDWIFNGALFVIVVYLSSLATVRLPRQFRIAVYVAWFAGFVYLLGFGFPMKDCL
jgi:hypothetical protein